MTGGPDTEAAAVATALALPPEADIAVIVGRIEAMRVVREASTFDRVRDVLALPADASLLACAGELCDRLPASWHHAAVLAMHVIEMNERARALRVDLIRRDAIGAARGDAAD